MDDFVRNNLIEWGLGHLIETFEGQRIDKEGLLCLEKKDIEKLIPKLGEMAKFRRRVKLLKRQHDHQEAADFAQAGPSTSSSKKKSVNRNLDFGELQPPPKRQKPAFEGSCSEEIMSNVKTTMRDVDEKLHLDDNTKLNAFLKTKIDALENNERALVGVFGRTGAGKSSLINTIIGEFNLLPSGSVTACTSVMIKVEANMNEPPKYQAEIEFMTKEEWKDELWSLENILRNDPTNSEDKAMPLTVYGEKWEKIFHEDHIFDKKYFKEIPEFLHNKSKILEFESSEALSKDLIKYTKTESFEEKEEGRKYWPLVKCVTVRVPNNPLLQHITLVDLPGCGDCNKSRDNMWRELVGSCSTVWIVTEINRAGSESEAWEILEDACSHIGNGGQCQQIHFICTKSELPDKCNISSKDALRSSIFKRNKKTKEIVKQDFTNRPNIKEHFSTECLKVFTVSSWEFQNGEQSFPTTLEQDETEIPELRKCLQDYDYLSETFNYVSGAYGILSLMQGARREDTVGCKTEVCSQLDKKLQEELRKIRKTMDDIYESFGKCLTEGVKSSESSCEEILKKIFPKKKNKGFHRTLKCLVKKSGVHKTEKGKLINLNADLSSKLTGSINYEFKKNFPNERKCSPFNGVISDFSLDTKKLIKNYKDVELQLIFLKTEEEKLKTELNIMICKEKKTVYWSLTEKVKEALEPGYTKASKFTGDCSEKMMKETLEQYLQASKDSMFKEAKDVMLQNLKKLMDKILEKMEKTLNESIEKSLKTDDKSYPDFSKELDQVKQYYKKLTTSPNEEM